MEDNKESLIKRVETFQKKDKFDIFKRNNTKKHLFNKNRNSIELNESNNNINNNANRSLFHQSNQGKTHLLMKKFQKQSKMRRFSTISNFMLNKPNNQNKTENVNINNTNINNDAVINTSILEKLNENKIEEEEDKNDYPKKKPKIFLPEVEFNKIDILKENKIYKHNKNDLLKEIDNYFQIKTDIEKMKKNEKTLMKELIKAKSSRNGVLDDIYKLRNEIEKTDIINSSFIENQKEQNNKEIEGKSLSPKITFESNFYLNTVNTVQSENEIIEKYIDQYEEKILKTKQDNQILFENFDELNQEYDLIKKQNESFKKKLNSLEILIKNTLQEKNELKSIFEESNY